MKKSNFSRKALEKMGRGHPWVLATDVLDRGSLPKRAGAVFLDPHWWLHSPQSFIRLRRLGPPQKNWLKNPKFQTLSSADPFHAYFGPWLLEHLKHKLLQKRRQDLCLRWIFSENDFIPGLIVDVFQNILVCQINSAPVELFWLSLRRALEQAYLDVVGHAPKRIVELRNSSVRTKEGLDIIPCEAGEEIPLLWNGLQWWATPGLSQKTGAYFDQRDNHTRTAHWARTHNCQTAWDLCTYQGGFALHLVQAGVSVTAVDQSAPALASARRNLQLNQLPEEKLQLIEADVFTWLEAQSQRREKVDLVVLDPPSFVKSREKLQPALKGYSELNTLAMKCLNPGGLLVSCVCSHHVTPELFEKALKDAAKAAGKEFQVLEVRGPSDDHAPADGFEEGHYLQAWFLKLRDTLSPEGH